VSGMRNAVDRSEEASKEAATLAKRTATALAQGTETVRETVDGMARITTVPPPATRNPAEDPGQSGLSGRSSRPSDPVRRAS